jgi:biopolymer transport protein TolR
MGMGGGGGTNTAVSDINVTPLIDVLLVLLIIFMVIVPTTPRGLDALVPQPPKPNAPPPPPNDRTIVVQIQSHGNAPPTYKINDQDFAKNDLEPELTKIFAARQEKVMFVKGDADLNYGTVAEVIGMGHTADVTNIGIITPQVEAGH